MALSFHDDSVPTNARVWDFVMPPKSWSTIPLSSECLTREIFQVQAARRIRLRTRMNARMTKCGMASVQ